ncbi:hypothetical protein TeGR_g14855, partial [Tetraparma gracilis]
CSSLPTDFAFPASVTKGNAVLWGTGTALESQERAKVCIEREQYSLDAYGRATFKEGVETIKKVEEEDRKKINEVIINEGAKVIGEDAFQFCEELTAVSVPSTVVEIGFMAFWVCYKLADIQLPEGLLKIGSSAFHRCKELPSDFIEKLPASIIKIARDAFKDTPLHEQGITRSLKRKEGYSVDDETGTIATFGEGVETIEIQDEEDKKKVVKVFIGNGAIAIAENAFRNCKELAVVSVPATLETIGKAAFSE